MYFTLTDIKFSDYCTNPFQFTDPSSWCVKLQNLRFSLHENRRMGLAALTIITNIIITTIIYKNMPRSEQKRMEIKWIDSWQMSSKSLKGADQIELPFAHKCRQQKQTGLAVMQFISMAPHTHSWTNLNCLSFALLEHCSAAQGDKELKGLWPLSPGRLPGLMVISSS